MRRWVVVLSVGVGLACGSWVLAAGMAGNADEMVGAARCGQCHPAAYAAWKASDHAGAHDSLDKKQGQDPRCTQCHGPGDKDVAGVQCESCHGPGIHYAFRYVMRDKVLSRIVGLSDPDEKTCRHCHTDTAPTIKPFDYNRLWGFIAHGLDPKAQADASQAKAEPAK